jgi:hypothetical protein
MQAADIDLIDVIRRQLMQAKRDLLSIKMLVKDRKYDPDQPRVPGGEPDAGQWTSTGGGEQEAGSRDWRSAMASKRSEAFCNRQYEIDLLRCRATASPGCYSQSME